MKVTLFHPLFTMLGGAEVLVIRHAGLLRSLEYDVQLLTQKVNEAQWRPWTAAHDVRIQALPAYWWDRHLGRSLRRRLARDARRVARASSGSACLVAYNAPASTIVGTISAPDSRTVWHCNEPPRYLHFGEVSRALVARLSAAGEPARAGADASLALRWAVDEMRRAAANAKLAEARTVDVERARRIERVVTLSAYSRESIRRVYGRIAEAVVPPFVPEPTAVPRRAGVDRTGGGLHALLHSRIDYVKNVDTVFRGFARFRARVAGAHVLHVVGTGPAVEPLRVLGEELGLGPWVRWHGYLSERDLTAVYARCDVFALVPFDEPFGMVFPEAAMRGLLLIGPDHGGPLEILDGGALGRTVDPLDVEQVADAFEQVWRSPDAWVDERRTRAMLACRSRFGAAAVAPQLRAGLLE